MKTWHVVLLFVITWLDDKGLKQGLRNLWVERGFNATVFDGEPCFFGVIVVVKFGKKKGPNSSEK